MGLMGELGIWLGLLSNLQVKSFCLSVFWVVARQEFDGVSFSGLWVDVCCGVKCRAGCMEMDGRWWIGGWKSVRGLKREQTGIIWRGLTHEAPPTAPGVLWSVLTALVDTWQIRGIENGDGSTQTDTQPFYRPFFFVQSDGSTYWHSNLRLYQSTSKCYPPVALFVDFIEFREVK